jgi:hypothetical protein
LDRKPHSLKIANKFLSKSSGRGGFATFSQTFYIFYRVDRTLLNRAPDEGLKRSHECLEFK